MRFLPGLVYAVYAVCAAGQTYSGSAALDDAVERAVREDRFPGAVLLVGREGRVVHLKAYGNRALVPRTEAMTADTVFDCASLTKVVATTSAVMKLFEEGRIRLNDPVTAYLPGFQGGTSPITVRNLMTHFSGLRPDLDLEPEWSGYETGIRLALQDKPRTGPGARFVYSDINFILLGEIVRKVSGMPLDRFVRARIFDPLGMRETTFLPGPALLPRIAPTEAVKGRAPLRGVVHDPTARAMGGVAGHAGLFSTATDLARFAFMMLNKGELEGARVFSPLTVDKFTEPQSPPDQSILRGLGWDIDSPYSGNRGELYPIGSYGHTGFTGTSMWIDPSTRSFVILLTNSVHPHRRPVITPVRSQIATLAAASFGIAVPGVRLTGYDETLARAGVRREVARTVQTLTGLDVLVEGGFAEWKGKKVAVITNQTGLDREGRRNIDLMVDAGVEVLSIFSPEHGLFGTEDQEKVADTMYKAGKSGRPIKVWSLYAGPRRRPTAEMLRGVEALVFDIQDIGCRFYTYIATMGYGMEEAARFGIPYYVLDRPNPITGLHVEGPLLDSDKVSIVGYFPIPLRHGMTSGEMAAMFNAENHIGADLRVIPMKNWERGDWYDSTGLVWTDPSPNMRSLNAALLYPGIGMIERSRNYSVGRGTAIPFELIGADFVKGRPLAAYLNQRQIPGIRTYPVKFRPTASNFAGRTIEGIRFVITNREIVNSVRLGLEVACALEKLYPGKIDFRVNDKLIGNQDTLRRLSAGEDPRQIEESYVEPLEHFLAIRSRYLIYPRNGGH
jgi:uncharacterized protein YbbC (DUF1343 family)/CubicO group peptidase (beta-lactamase class C family)